MSAITPQLQEQRKAALLNAALREFAEYGYEQASTNRIAKEAGLSKPLMFHYVGNKQQLFLFVYEYFFDLLNKEYYRQLDCTEPDVIKRLHGAYRLQLRLLYAYPWVFDFFKMYAGMDIRIFDEDLQQRLKKCRRTVPICLNNMITVCLYRSWRKPHVCRFSIAPVKGLVI